MVEPWEPDHLDRRRLLARAGGGLEPVGVDGRHLGVEQRLHHENRLVDIAHDPRGIEREEASEPRDVSLLPQRRRDLVPSISCQHRCLNLFLQLDRRLLFGLGPVGLCERACHLRQVQFGAGHSGRRDQHESRYPILPVGRQQADRSALAVTDDGQPSAIDVLSIADEPDGRAQVFGEVCERGRLGAAATLADAPLVVAQHEVTRVGQRTGELAEDRNADDGLIAIGQARPADEHDGRQRFASGTGRLRDRSRQREPICGNPDLFVSGSHAR